MKRNWNLSMIIAMVLLTSIITSCTNNTKEKNKYESEIATLKNQLLEIAKTNEAIAKNIKTFDELDFVIYSNQEWQRFHESHTDDVMVHYPDGQITKGLDAHLNAVKPLFVFAPDTRIEEHPIKIGSDNITAVTGVTRGTFTKPLPLGNGKFIQPTGKKFEIPMCTIGLWNKEGKMYEEFLYWDNQALLKQIGIAN